MFGGMNENILGRHLTTAYYIKKDMYPSIYVLGRDFKIRARIYAVHVLLLLARLVVGMAIFNLSLPFRSWTHISDSSCIV